MKKLFLILFLILCNSSYAAPVRPSGSVAVSGTTISSSAYNNDLNTVYNYLSAGVDTYASGTIANSAISSSAAIAYSKLNLTGSILNADLAGSIAASKLVGTDIATVGTITAGTWNGTSISTTYGGTGQNFGATSQGSLPYFSAAGVISALGTGTAGQVLQTQGAGANPQWAFPSGQLGSWVVKTGGTVYQALTDGIFIATCTSSGGAGTHSLVINSDGSNPPTTARCASANVDSTNVAINACTIPVRKNDYYKAVESACTDNAIFFIAIGS